MAKKSTFKGSWVEPKARRSQEWLPPLPNNKGSIVYGLNGHQITTDAWDYELAKNIEFIPMQCYFILKRDLSKSSPCPAFR